MENEIDLFLFFYCKSGSSFHCLFPKKVHVLHKIEVSGRRVLIVTLFMFSEKLGGCKVRVTSRIKKDTFDGILKLGSGLKKKKKGGKKVHYYQ